MQIATGEEGFTNDPSAQQWYNNGSQGVDYAANLKDPNVAFATIHICELPHPCASSLLWRDRASMGSGLSSSDQRTAGGSFHEHDS